MKRFTFIPLLFLFLLLIVPVVVFIFRSPSSQAIVVSPQITHIPATPTFVPTPTPQPKAIIGLVGDLGLGRHITSTARTKNNFNWSFQAIAPWLDQNDITFANLESPIIEDCPLGATGTFTFCGDTRFLPYLKQYKFAFNLANNHMFNYGAEGFSQTKKYLDDNAINYVYSSNPDTEFTKITINNITFGLLGYDFITNPNLDEDKIIQAVKKYNPQVDWLVVSLHWGNEYLPQAEVWRHTLAYRLIDAGADIIHGHHPHVWQPDEIYQDKPIFYSFGNFIFDQSWSYETSHTNIVRLEVTKDQILSSQKFPVEIKYNSQPVLRPSISPASAKN